MVSAVSRSSSPATESEHPVSVKCFNLLYDLTDYELKLDQRCIEIQIHLNVTFPSTSRSIRGCFPPRYGIFVFHSHSTFRINCRHRHCLRHPSFKIWDCVFNRCKKSAKLFFTVGEAISNEINGVSLKLLDGMRHCSKFYFGFEILTAVTMKFKVFWDVTPCSLETARRFGRTHPFWVLTPYCLYIVRSLERKYRLYVSL